MIKRLSLLFILWVAIIFVASTNEGIIYGWQPLVETSNEAASATITGHAAFPPVERESRTAENALNTRKKAILRTAESHDDLLTLGLGTRGAYPSYPSPLGQTSRPEIISVLKENPIHLADTHQPFKFKSYDHRLSLSGVSLEQVSSQASSSTRRRDFLSDFDKTREKDSSASTKHYIPSPTNRPESLSESFNLGKKTQLQSDAPLTRGPLGNSGTHDQNGGRGTKRKLWSSWGNSLSLKTGVTSEENDTEHSYATPDFLSSFTWEQLYRLSAEENRIDKPQFNPQEIQQVMRPFQLGSYTPFYQNSGAPMGPVLSAGHRIPRKKISMAGQNGGNVFLSLRPPAQGGHGKSWGADQGKTFSPMSQPQYSLRAKQNILLDSQGSTELLLNRLPRVHHKTFESGIQGSSSENPEKIPQLSKIPKPYQPEIITTVGNHASQIDCIKDCGRIKFNTDLFKGEGPNQTGRNHIVELLNSIPRPYNGKFLLTYVQLGVACENIRRKHPGGIGLRRRPYMDEVGVFMDNITNWYQYWKTHANIDLESVHKGEGASKYQFILPILMIYVEMIISIIPFKQELPLGGELDYPDEMRNAVISYLKFNTLMKNPPENGDIEVWNAKRMLFKVASSNANQEPSGILWYYIEFWLESHYTDLWIIIKEKKGFHVAKDFKAFFNTIFTQGIETLNKRAMLLSTP